LDRRPLDVLVGRQRLPREYVERLDERELGERCALDDLVGLRGIDYRFFGHHNHRDHRLEHWRADVD
jgi:hypothetical protein